MIDEAWAGSSPLTRGKPSCTACPARQSRLIPAHAGKTKSLSHSSDLERAHPRSRGENTPRSGVYMSKPGSSPLTRGKPEGRRPHGERAGLIPAHAGKTTRSMPASTCPRAHPRSRGENPRTSTRNWVRCGSSPLTRGKRVRRPWRRWMPAAHPRSRGENSQR